MSSNGWKLYANAFIKKARGSENTLQTVFVIAQLAQSNCAIIRPFISSSPSSSKLWYKILKAHRARATRILQPPLKSLSCFFCIALVKPRPLRIREALISALSASSSSKRSYNSISFSHSAKVWQTNVNNSIHKLQISVPQPWDSLKTEQN